MAEETSQDPSVTPELIAVERVLAAIDLGQAGAGALRTAHARLAGTAGVLAVAHVLVDPPAEVELAAERIAEARATIRGLLAELGVDPDAIHVLIATGDPGEQIAEMAASWNATLLVIGQSARTHGILSRLFRPGTVAQVVRQAPCPVLVHRPSPGNQRIVVGTDLADPSVPVLRAAAAEQARSGGTVYAVHCLSADGGGVVDMLGNADLAAEEPRARLARAAEAAGLRAVPTLFEGDPAEGLVHVATALGADLVIVGSHGGGSARLGIASVTQEVVDEAPCPVLVVRLDADQP